MWIQAWGLIHSILVTTPCSLMGLVESNSAANAWCAQAGAALTSKLRPAIASFSIEFLLLLRVSLLRRPRARQNIRHGVVPFVTSVLEDGPLCPGHGNLRGPGPGERRGIVH